MNTISKYATSLLLVCGLIYLNSCKKEEPALPDNLVSFESAALGFGSAENETTLTVTLSRAATSAGTIIVLLEPHGLVYGTDFTTEPAASSNVVTLTVPAGATSAALTVKKVDGILFDGDETIKFTIQSSSMDVVLGVNQTLTLTFAEILAESGSMEISGGGSTYPNKVFIDFSGNRQTSVDRTTWDLGFASGDAFRVILNSSNGMMVRALDKNNLNDVTAADTVGWGTQLSIAAVFAAITSDTPPDWVNEAIAWIDDPTGDLTKTAIAEVSATASENKVYIVNRGDGPGTPGPNLGWKKIRVVHNGSNYTLQYADIAATSFTSVEVTKDPAARFNYISLTTGAVSVEPAADKWDIAWTGFTNSTDFGTGPVPYYFQDIILLNTGHAQAAKVLTSAVAYDAFTEANLTGLTFGTSQLSIGSDWRSGGGPSTAPSIRSDRYYIVLDADGNYYKVRFTALTTNGERGKPQLEYALVK